ncbi:OFA family MFS transporter [Metallosphaera tengchongensis]|uniref:OFA family MFS transporter n=1 Tax=Metallosphaera tengchongensis TaxID=1532350 RepID=A0A6N0NZP9_9CREN|nr:MFS transporter [Metallosphaera tengchongensis]QKR00611.1 OFA family MFS transporter [Metallosphaera tengchongensis]
MRRRLYLLTGFVAMLFNSTLQYSWNAYEPLLIKGFNATPSRVEIAFALFVLFSTSFQVFSGRFADIYGPKSVGVAGSVCLSIGLILGSLSPNLTTFYLAWTLGSVGEGIVYGVSLNLALKWYQERRGLASGLVSMGFGLGGAIANPFIEASGNFRLPMGVIGTLALTLVVLFSLSSYPKGQVGVSPGKVLKEPRFWTIYLSFTFASIPLLVFSASLTQIASYLNSLYYTLITVVFPIVSGTGRPLLGYLTDKLGRLRGIDVVNFSLLLATVFAVFGYAEKSPTYLIGSAVAIGIFGGSSYTLYSALVGDIYGPKYSTLNTSILYTGKIISGVLGSFAFSTLFEFSPKLGLLFLLGSSITSILVLMLLHFNIDVRSR